MRTIGMIVGILLWAVSIIMLFIYWFAAMTKWFGFIVGSILALIITPGLIVFPFVFWFVEGVFPSFYFILYLISIVGIIIFGISYKEKY